MKRINIILIVLSFSMLLLLGACTQKEIVIGVSQCCGGVWREKVNNEMRLAQYQYKNVDLLFTTAENDGQRQARQIDSMIVRKVDLIVVAPDNVNDVTPAIERAYRAHIPVILFDRKVKTTYYTASIGGDNVEAGREVARFLASKLDGKGTVVEITGLKDASPVIERHRGFHEVMKNYPGIKVVTLESNWKLERAQELMKQYLDNGGHADGVFGHSDLGAIGAFLEAERRGIDKQMLIVGIDGLPGEWEGVDRVKRGQFAASYVYPTQGENASIDPFGVKKIGVPSMGGVIIILAILVPVLLLGRLRNIYLILMIITTVWLGFLGGMDDFIKIFKRDKEGLKGKYKIIGQIGIGLIVGLVLWSSPDVKMNENLAIEQQGQETVVKHRTEARKSLKTTIPFVKGHNLDYSSITSFCGKYKVAAGWILFVIMTIFVVTAVSNGANLNDGMDGMCAGNSAIIGVALGILAYVSSHIEFAAYLNIMYIPGSEELVVFFCAFIGALIGFLWYNAYPAQVFMGDTGSLTIGGIIAVGAIIIHKELMLPILCGIFFVESLSVMMQVYYYKIGKRRGVKQRIFKRTPIHDNFRTQDSQLDPDCKYLWKKPRNCFHESKITIRFWIVTIILAALTIITLKIR